MTFTINGKKYESAKYSFNTHCRFEELGANALELQRKPTIVCRAYLAICGDMSLEEAGEEIEQHFINGGDLSEMIIAFAKELNESGFFMAMIERAKEPEEKKKPTKTTRKSAKSTEV